MSTPYTPPGTDPTGNPHPHKDPPPQPADPKPRPLDEPQREDLGEHYAVEDEVLPILLLESPCTVRIDIGQEEVKLFIGPRDWVWKRGCPDLLACGTVFDPPLSDEGTA